MTRPRKPEPPKVVPPTLLVACERLAYVVDEPLTTKMLDELWPTIRSDIVALLAAVGWSISIEQARSDIPLEHTQEPLL